MKKAFLMAVLVLLALPSIAGNKEKRPSPYRYEANIAWGYTPNFSITSFDDYAYFSYNTLDYMYRNYIGRKVTTGLISADFNIQYKKWFALGIQLNAVAITNTEMSAITKKASGKFTEYSLSLLPYARFTYMNREFVKLYSAVGAGLSFNHDVLPQGYAADSRNNMSARFQLVPFGVMAGRRFYGLAELGLGTEYMGFRIGAGYRF